MSTELIRIPGERADQLRRLAEHKGGSVADLIGQLIAAEVKRLGLGPQIGLGSTVDIAELENGQVHFSAADLGTFIWSKEATAAVAGAIDNALGRKGGALDLDAGLEIARVGTSIKIRNIETDEARSFAPSIAKELAALLRAAS